MLRTKDVTLLAAIIGLAACDDGPGDPVGPSDDPLAMAIVSGHNQSAKAGEQLSERLVVRVTDSSGRGVARVPVSWRVTSGGGITSLVSSEFPPSEPWGVTTTRTDPEGLADVSFWPTRLGKSEITATIDPLAGEPAIFTTEATVLVIHNAFWGIFFWPDDPGARLRVGDVIEWSNWHDVTVEIASTSVPPGGESFSAVLNGGERFQFRPGTSGSWHWTYRYRDAAGKRIDDSGGSDWLIVEPEF